MCGIAGLWFRGGRDPKLLGVRIESMNVAQLHRGPDSGGTWLDSDEGLAFGHRRLSILDLSAAGHQPMLSPCSRYVLTFNGEIYNHVILRDKLSRCGYSFQGTSDTETISTGFTKWGVSETFNRLEGMFAIAVWDRREHELTLARDRFGEKPLYMFHAGGVTAFASELKALERVPEVEKVLDPTSIQLFLKYNYLPSPRTMYKSISTVQPAEELIFDRMGLRSQRRYWQVYESLFEAGRTDGFKASFEDAVTEFTHLAKKSVRERLVADVPVGVFLSGGIDSGLVAACASDAVPGGIEAYTVAYGDPNFDEAIEAATTAQLLGAKHHTLTLTDEHAQKLIQSVPSVFDEPLGDSAMVPTLALCRFARERVTVALTGDGGDELFGGYRSYAVAARYLSKLRQIGNSAGVLSTCQRIYHSAISGSRSQTLRRADLALGALAHIPVTSSYDAIMAEHSPLALSSKGDLDGDASMWPDSVNETVNAYLRGGGDLASAFMYLDLLHYLPDALLVKTDRASMAASLECRVPLLSRELAEFAFRLPLKFKIGQRGGKLVMRAASERLVKSKGAWAPKKGFDLPIGKWLKGPLRDWTREHLSAAAIAKYGVLEPRRATAKTEAFMSGRLPYSANIWAILMLQAWLANRNLQGPRN